MVEKLSVKGIAIKPCVSRNGIKYTAEELMKFAPTLAGRPILKDHEAKTDNTIGIVQDATFINNSVMFDGWVKDEGVIEKIKDGRVSEVSIGALCGRIVEEEGDDGEIVMVAEDMTAVELSVVPIPGVIGTQITQSAESLTESLNESDNTIYETFTGDEKMDENVVDNDVTEKRLDKRTSADPRDGHVHVATFDAENGMGFTSNDDGTESTSHNHKIVNFEVVPREIGDYTSIHPGMLNMEEEEKEEEQETESVESENETEENNDHTTNSDNDESIKSDENVDVKNSGEETDVKTEEIKMVEETKVDNKLNEQLKEKETMIAEKDAELNEMKAKLDAIEKAEFDKLANEYVALAEKVGVNAENTDNLSKEMLMVLSENLKVVNAKLAETAEKVEVKETETKKAKSKLSKVDEEYNEMETGGYTFERVKGNKFSLTKEPDKGRYAR